MTIPRNLVFVSYTRQDAKWLKRLQVHLKPLVRDEILCLWDDTMIQPGAVWRDDIANALSCARIAIMLVSADFFASEFITNNELPPLLDKASTGGTIIMPVIVGHCAFARHPGLSKYQAMNSPERPLAAMPTSEREATLSKLAHVVEKVMQATSKASASNDAGRKRKGVNPLASVPGSRAATLPNDIGIAGLPTASQSRLFGVVPNVADARLVVPSAAATAVRVARDQIVSAPRREVAVVLQPVGHGLAAEDIAQIARGAQIHGHVGNPVFPDFALHMRPERIGDCVHWCPVADEDQDRVFAISSDASLATIEVIRESAAYATRYGVSGVSILACLRRVLGAALFARVLASRNRNLGHAWLVLRLELVPDMHLAIEPSGQALRDPSLDKFVTNERELREGGWFDPRMDNENVEAFVLKIIGRVAYRFGYENYRQSVEFEIRRVLGMVRTPSASARPAAK